MDSTARQNESTEKESEDERRGGSGNEEVVRLEVVVVVRVEDDDDEGVVRRRGEEKRSTFPEGKSEEDAHDRVAAVDARSAVEKDIDGEDGATRASSSTNKGCCDRSFSMNRDSATDTRRIRLSRSTFISVANTASAPSLLSSSSSSSASFCLLRTRVLASCVRLPSTSGDEEITHARETGQGVSTGKNTGNPSSVEHDDDALFLGRKDVVPGTRARGDVVSGAVLFFAGEREEEVPVAPPPTPIGSSGIVRVAVVVVVGAVGGDETVPESTSIRFFSFRPSIPLLSCG